MPNSATNTKIEATVEALESLTNAIVAHQAPNNPMSGATFQNIADARKELKTALSEFLAPTIRLATDNGVRVAERQR
jgi:hypothetical protein